jgi:hypothetical protein
MLLLNVDCGFQREFSLFSSRNAIVVLDVVIQHGLLYLMLDVIITQCGLLLFLLWIVVVLPFVDC